MKVIVLACLVGLAMCAPQQQRYEQPAPPPPRYEQPFDSEEVKFDPEPYQFSLAVADDEFTNYQSRVESQDENGNVQGEYSWVGPDGIRYITQYTADPINGFQVNTVEEQTDIKVRIPEPVPIEEQAGYRYE
ncbi:larval cuticle protein A2B-like [Portunus trituberculatus]|uniref:larval cuticle protein A2B-like n=1 Tax=Portunus trituberculatus TaxID=210409 RepID=UPI001E1D177C|nr:larval cuticle protein A2B-like [Portunus trituberculatus]